MNQEEHEELANIARLQAAEGLVRECLFKDEDLERIRRRALIIIIDLIGEAREKAIWYKKWEQSR